MTAKTAAAPIAVSITPNYRMTADERQYVLKRKHTVDPSRHPFKKPLEDGPIREEWRDVGYYPLNHGGLISAVERAIINEVNDTTEARTLSDLLVAYAKETTRVRAEITVAMLPHFQRVGDAPGTTE
ncbi:hypothetical protein [Cohnella silvisoli]|uniref:Uncharacterized protein n=1 Tax=Cohnella silvisoli TaxID=2873699 RepID=A0ABV1KYS4_9BACL|nr:hypothetical protein [Cohnella silvisoli]MCD9024383.1 hypothetical protein [Cohnella silvisoli]